MREMAKTTLNRLCTLAVLPAYVAYRLASLVLEPDQAFHGASQGMSLLPGVSGEYLRRAFYRLTLEACSDDCCLSFGTVFSKRGARVGRRVYVGTGCTLGLVTLEDDALLASNVDVLSGSGQHVFDDPRVPIREQGGEFNRVIVGADTWIGNRAVVMASVGRGAIVGAGSVVTKAIPERALAVGSPARVVGWRGEPGAAERSPSCAS